MRKEAINSFSDGLIKDMNELTTPDKALTNCLNGTLITYNGNEFSLLNDMGNVKVGTSYLSPGYVPVGMKEHGGIIYVASYNPKTKKGQIGSFPSPQQIYGDEEKDFTNFLFNIASFIKLLTNSETTPLIYNEFTRTDIFATTATNKTTYKEFHPGDRFIISTTAAIPPAVIDAVKEGVLKFRLASISKSGGLEYIDDSNLKLYNYTDTDRTASNGLFWLYLNTSTETIDNLITDNPDKILIYNAKNSGRLMIVVEFNTFNTFNLYRNYKLNEDHYTANFWGNATGTLNSEYICGANGIEDNTLSKTVTLDSNTISDTVTNYGNKSYTIYPVAVSSNGKVYGVLDRLKKSGIINFDTLRKNKNQLGSWNYYISDTTVTIDWTYDYFDIDETKLILKLNFVFIDLESIDTSSFDPTTATGSYQQEVIKESYNGDFEDIFPIAADKLKTGTIYVCRIDKYFNGIETPEPVTYNYVYTGTYFNTHTFDITSTTLTRPEINIPIETTYTSTTTSKDTKYYKNAGWKSSGVNEEISTPTISQYVIPTSSDATDYEFLTTKGLDYQVDVKINSDFDITSNYKSTDFVGTPNTDILDNLVTGVTTTINSGTPKYNSTDSTLLSHISSKEYINNSNGATVVANTYKTEWIIKPTVYRYIWAKLDVVTTKNVNTERLFPIYDNTDSSTNKSKLFSFYESSGNLICVGGERDGDGEIYYNTIINGESSTTGNSRGNSVGNGYDDSALQLALNNMGNGTVGIFAGCGGSQGSLRFRYTLQPNEFVRPKRGPYFWYNTDGEIDKNDNYLLLTWKGQDGQHRFVNLASRKSENNAEKLNKRRLDVMIKAILSLLLIAKNVKLPIAYTAPNKSLYIYNTSFNSDLIVTPSFSAVNGNLDFTLSTPVYNNGEITNTVEKLLAKWEDKKLPGLVNYLPKFTYTATPIAETIELGSDISIEDGGLLNCYLTAYSNPVDSTLTGSYSSQITNLTSSCKYKSTDSLDATLLRTYVFRGEVTNISNDGICTLTSNDDGSPKVIGIAGSESSTYSTIRYWSTTPGTNFSSTDSRDISICNINKMFKSLVRLNATLSSPIENDFYNELLARDLTQDCDTALIKSAGDTTLDTRIDAAVSRGIGRLQGRWVQGKDKNAPDMDALIHFGLEDGTGLSVYNYLTRNNEQLF